MAISSENQSKYLNRTLSNEKDENETVWSNDSELLKLKGSTVILGEPGMGKSELMQYLGRLVDIEPVSAVRFMNAKDPSKFLQTEKPLIIDGLDEAMARREGDAVDAILEQLEKAGHPKFILSCRSREWENRTARNLKQIYGREPNICTLMELSEVDARNFLQLNHSTVDPSKIIQHLNDANLADLYKNPLMLGLMATVAEVDDELPRSKGSLLGRVTEIIWSEHDEDRSVTGLSKLSNDSALNSAGTIFALLLLGGKDVVFFGSAAQALPDDLLIWDKKNFQIVIIAGQFYHQNCFEVMGQIEPNQFTK